MRQKGKESLIQKIISFTTFLTMFLVMFSFGTVTQKVHADENDAVIYGPFYAIDATYEAGVWENTNAGYTGEAYVNLDNKVGSNITWTVNVEEEGNYLVTFNIANGSVSDRKMKIEVNNGEQYWLQSFTSTGSWTIWAERGIVLPLKSGENTIKATSYTDEGGPNLDYIKLEKTDEPIAPVYDPNSEENNGENNKTTIYIAGDSTAQSYAASYAPQQGWGYYLEANVPDTVQVVNRAIAGRSSKSFYDNGRLDKILEMIQEGDYLLVQFGINDSAYNKPERYAPVCGSVENAEDGSFEFYIKKYVEGALAHNATPVLMSPSLGLKAYSDVEGKFLNTYSNYGDAMNAISEYYDIPYIDLNTSMADLYNEIGFEAASLYHLFGVVEGSTDKTHFSDAGASRIGEVVGTAMTTIINGDDAEVTLNSINGKKSIYQFYKVKSLNNSIDLDKLKIVYKADNLTETTENFKCNWASMQLKVRPWCVYLAKNVSGEFTDNKLSIEIDKEVTLVAGEGNVIIQTRLSKIAGSEDVTLENENVEVYYNGVRVQ